MEWNGMEKEERKMKGSEEFRIAHYQMLYWWEGQGWVRGEEQREVS